MKKYVALSILFTVACGARADVMLSNPGSVPTENVPVSQLNSAGSNQQARNRMGDLSDWRGISQTFQWNSPDNLDGIGLHFANQQADFAWSSTSTQTYVLVVQAIDGGNIPEATVAQVEFELPGDKVAANQWLYMDIDDLSLSSGHWYGFTICPASSAVNGALRTFWDMADSADYYAGRGSQWNPNVSGLPKTDAYGSQGDLTFYMQSIPEPGTLGLVAFCAMAALFLRRLVM